MAGVGHQRQSRAGLPDVADGYLYYIRVDFDPGAANSALMMTLK